MKLLIIVTLIAAGVTASSEESPPARSVPAKKDAFAVDTEKPFHFELGRGSGMDGLDTVAFGHDGDVTIFRQRPQGKWQTAKLKLAPIAIARIFEVVKSIECGM